MADKEEKKSEATTAEEIIEEIIEQKSVIAYKGTADLGEHNQNAVVLFKAFGWKYRHLVDYEKTRGAVALGKVIVERIHDWTVWDEDGNPVPFQPLEMNPGTGNVIEGRYSAECLFELEPAVMAWITQGWLYAYNMAGNPDPN